MSEIIPPETPGKAIIISNRQGPSTVAKVVIFIVIILVIIALGVIGWFVRKNYSAKVSSVTQDDINTIRNNFNHPSINTASTTPASSPVTQFIMPRGSETLEQKLPPKPPLPTLPTILTPVTYTNPTLGFSIQINQTWQAQDNGDNQSVTFTNAQGQNISVQVYMAVGESLSDVENQLSGSSSVSNLIHTNFLGEPALQFNMSKGSGLAIIHNAKLYYIMAPNLNQEPVTTFKFE